MANDINKYMKNVEMHEGNSSSIHLEGLDFLSKVTQGEKTLVDANTPMSFLMSISAANCASAINASWTCMENQYPSVAKSSAQLYHHMSDNDYPNRFATPCRDITFLMLISKSEIDAYAITDPATGQKKLVLPGDTEYKVKGIRFYHHNPIVITKSSFGKYQVFYDLENRSPLNTLSDTFEWNEVYYNDKHYLALFIPVEQIGLDVTEWPVTKSTGVNLNIPFEDSFYHCRVFRMDKTTQKWAEMKTTHSDLAYDVYNPTAVLKVHPGFLNIYIPEIYLTHDLVGDSIRVFIYNTKGEIQENLSDIDVGTFEVSWQNFRDKDLNYISAVTKMTDFLVSSENDAIGGRNELSLLELKESIVNNRGFKTTPILEDELKSALKTKGYKLSRIRSTVLGNEYLATSTLEDENNWPFAPIGCALSTLNIDINDADLSQSINVHPGNVRSTILPKSLYKQILGGYELVKNHDLARISAMTKENLVNYLNANRYFFNPFYVVLDGEKDTFGMRGYYLDDPVVKNRNFEDNTKAVSFNINTTKMVLNKVESGFELIVDADIPEGLTSVDLQLKINVEQTGETWYLLPIQTTLGTSKAKFKFMFETHYDIKKNDAISFINLLNGTNTVGTGFIPLQTRIELFYLLEVPNSPTSSFDGLFSQIFYSATRTGITYESATLVFGEQLNNYYLTGRSILEPPVYQTHTSNEPLLYTSPVISGVSIDKTNNQIVYSYSHQAGDPVLKADGTPEYKWKAGDIVYDNSGQPIEVESTKAIREITLPIFDASFVFGSTPLVKEYLKNFPKTIMGHLNGPIKALSKPLLEHSTLYYSPSNSASVSQVKDLTGQIVSINTAFSIVVNLTLTKSGFDNNNIREQTKAYVKSEIAKLLKMRHVNMSMLYSGLLKSASSEVVGINIVKFLPVGEYAQLVNDIDDFTFGSYLKLLNNNEVDVLDNINFNFHKVDS